MSPKLLALVLALGTVFGGGGLPLFVPEERVRPAELLDAGITKGTPYPLECRVRVALAMRNALLDAGMGPRLQGRYGSLPFKGRRFGDAGVVMEDPPQGVELYGPSPCRPLTAGWDGGVAAVDMGCACAGSTGTCLADLPDGGSGAAPVGVTLAEGTWSGSGCRRKPCVEIAGESSWPANCPEK